jgi:osmotically-inducible protein OsmY
MNAILSSVIIAAVLAGQLPPTTPSAATERLGKEDLAQLARQVEGALIGDRIAGGVPLTVKVLEDSVVAIEGNVPTEVIRDRISRIASRAVGRASAQVVNNVRVQEADQTPKSTGAENAEPTILDDVQLQKLRALVNQKMPEAAKRVHLAFQVKPMPTIVLEGVLQSYDEKLALDRLVRENYKGLTILNNIRTYSKPEPAAAPPAQPPLAAPVVVVQDNNAIKMDADTLPADRPLALEVVTTLRAQKLIKDAAIVVQVQRDVVWLRGSVQSPQERVLALNKAQSVKGVDYVIDDLTVNVAPGQVAAGDLEADEGVAYIRNYVQRRLSRSAAIDVSAVENRIEVVVKDNFVDDEERLAVIKAIEELSQEIRKEVVVRVAKN